MRRPFAADPDRTYSIWPILIGFLVLAAIGVAGLVKLGSPSSPTETLPPFATTTTVASEPSADAPAAGDDAPEPTAPGGASLPDGVTDVTSAGGVTTYVYGERPDPPDDSAVAVVARGQVVPGVDDGSIVVDVSCTVADGELLAQVTVTETATAITVRPVVVASQGAAPCTATSPGRQLELPLQAPVGGRTLELDPAGTVVEVPTG